MLGEENNLHSVTFRPYGYNNVLCGLMNING